jgi:hypothetical protein
VGPRSLLDRWAGGIVDVQTPGQFMPGQIYNMLLQINGSSATLLVNNTNVYWTAPGRSLRPHPLNPLRPRAGLAGVARKVASLGGGKA